MHWFRKYKLFVFVIATRILNTAVPLILNLKDEKLKHINFTSFLASSLSFWDAHHYLYLAKNWYSAVGDEANYIVFQPLYPILIKFFSIFVGNHILSAVLISNIAFVFASLVFYKLLRMDFDKKTSEKIIILVCLFPTSYFFSIVYTESLFLLLSISSLYFIRKSRWVLAGFASGLAILTKHQGVILILVFLIEFINLKKRSYKNLAFYSIFPAIAVGFYLLLNYQLFGDPFAFSLILKNHWYKHFSFFWNGILQSLRIAFLKPVNQFSLMVGFAEAFASTTAWILVPLAFRKLRFSYAAYYLASVFLFTSTGFILSAPRYLLSIPVFFMLLYPLTRNKYVYSSWLVISSFLSIYLGLMYTSGAWAF